VLPAQPASTLPLSRQACTVHNSTTYATEANNMSTSAERASTSGLAAVAADLSPTQEDNVDDTNATAPLPRHSRFLQLLTVAQAAQRLHTTPQVILAAVAKNDLQPDLKIGNSMRFRVEALDAYGARCVESVALAQPKSTEAGTAELAAAMRDLVKSLKESQWQLAKSTKNPMDDSPSAPGSSPTSTATTESGFASVTEAAKYARTRLKPKRKR